MATVRMCNIGRLQSVWKISRRSSYLHPNLERNTIKNDDLEKYRKSCLTQNPEKVTSKLPDAKPANIEEYRHLYPEFLPHPNWLRRDFLKENLERKDMYRRRAILSIPEFYVGSIMAVTVADEFAPNKENRFVGICIAREGIGLDANFTLRNVVDNQGIEIRYEMYHPHIQKIEMLKLEKRLDEELYYLRDAPPEYSTIPFDFEPVQFAKGSKVSVNPIKVKLNPRPWLQRYERMNLKGVQDLELPQRFYDKAARVAKPWEEKDLMKNYRETINDDEAAKIFHEVSSHTSDFKETLKKL